MTFFRFLSEGRAIASFAAGLALSGVILLSPAEALAAESTGEHGASEVFSEAETINPATEYLCALSSLASYDDRVGIVARNALRREDWTVTSLREKTKDVSAKYILMKNESPEGDEPHYIVSVTGTSDLKDIKTDLSMRKVPFSGKTPEEFKKAARKKVMSPSEPLAHGGFLRYTDTAFFLDEKEKTCLGEELFEKLKENPDIRLCVTGHSLGGAVAVLFAARLMSMGIPAEQIEVVTFGAPAIGNQAFADAYGNMNLDRVTMAGDPIQSALQSLDGSYVQFGSVQRWARPRGSEKFAHAMAGYADMALRKYYDDKETKRREALRLLGEEAYAVKTSENGAPARGKVLFFADYSLDEAISDDLPYLKLATLDILLRETDGLVVAEETLPWDDEAEKVKKGIRLARSKGCRYVLFQRYASQRIKKQRDGYTVSLDESLYDDRENPLVIQNFTTNTNTMTPILAAMYDEIAGRERRIEVLSGGK